MRSSEIVIQEGPLDFAKKVAAGVKGALTPGQTASGSYSAKAAEQDLDRMAKNSLPAWKDQQVKDQARNLNLTGDELISIKMVTPTMDDTLIYKVFQNHYLYFFDYHNLFSFAHHLVYHKLRIFF